MEQFAIEDETIDEHAVGTEVRGEHEAIGGIDKNTVGMRRCLTLAIRPCSRMLHHLRGWGEGSFRPDREHRDTSTDIIGYEHHSPTAIQAHVTRRATF